MRWLVVMFCVISIKISAQKFTLLIIDNSINVYNDTLYFKLQISNQDSIPFAFYNFCKIPAYNLQVYNNTSNDNAIPGLIADIINKRGKLPVEQWGNSSPMDLKYFFGNEMYSVIRPKECREFKYHLSLRSINLKKGVYKLKLKYFSNGNYYKDEFVNEIKRNPDLLNCRMFIGEIESNSELFYYTPPFRRYYPLDR